MAFLTNRRIPLVESIEGRISWIRETLKLHIPTAMARKLRADLVQLRRERENAYESKGKGVVPLVKTRKPSDDSVCVPIGSVLQPRQTFREVIKERIEERSARSRKKSRNKRKRGNEVDCAGGEGSAPSGSCPDGV